MTGHVTHVPDDRTGRPQPDMHSGAHRAHADPDDPAAHRRVVAGRVGVAAGGPTRNDVQVELARPRANAELPGAVRGDAWCADERDPRDRGDPNTREGMSGAVSHDTGDPRVLDGRGSDGYGRCADRGQDAAGEDADEGSGETSAVHGAPSEQCEPCSDGTASAL